VPPFMEVSWRLRPSFICGSVSCFEEGASIEGRCFMLNFNA
jgi:hypothetical protein